MNMLINSVPDGLKIAGTEYKIHTDFSVWIEFEKLLSDESENAHKTISDIKNLIFCDKQPPQRADEETVNKILWFYRCGKKLQKSSHTSEKEIFSYDYDDGYIFSAFLEQYHIDLEQTKLHWWKFHALMLSLSDSTEFVKIMGYRSVEINSKMTASQKAYL